MNKKTLAALGIPAGILGGLYAWKKEHDYLRIASVNKGDTVVDVGAYNGLIFSIPVSEIVGENGVVYSIEPDGKNARRLKYNIALHNCKNITLIETGVWSEPVEKNWSQNGGASSVGNGDELQKLTTLDNICEKHEINTIDLIKMDIEGAEIEALKGMENTLKSTKQIIVASYHGSGLKKYLGCYSGGNTEEVSSVLRENGFNTELYYPGLVYGWKNG